MYFCNFTVTQCFSEGEGRSACVCVTDCLWRRPLVTIGYPKWPEVRNVLHHQHKLPDLVNVTISTPRQWLTFFSILQDSLWMSNQQRPNSHPLKQTRSIWSRLSCLWLSACLCLFSSACSSPYLTLQHNVFPTVFFLKSFLHSINSSIEHLLTFSMHFQHFLYPPSMFLPLQKIS